MATHHHHQARCAHLSLLASLLTLAIYLQLPGGTNACSCEQIHPQTSFCQADFVLKARVKDAGEMLYSERKVKRDGTSETQMYPTYLRYAIKISKIFKESPAFPNVTHDYVYTSPFDSSCGIHLNNQTKYLLEGYVHNGKPIVSLCSNIQPWDNVQVRQRKGYSYLYEKNCDCKVEICYGPQCDKNKANQVLSTCTMNPRKSWNCFNKYSLCIRRDDAKCHWSRSTLLKMCLEENRIKSEMQP